MANSKSGFPIPTPYAAGAESKPFAMAFSPMSDNEFSHNITVDREPVKIVAFGLAGDDYIEVMQLVGDNSGDLFEAYKPFDGAVALTSERNELVLSKSGRYRLRFDGTHGSMHCFWWQFSMTHEWANEVLSEGLRRLCECLQPPPFEIIPGPGIDADEINPVVWRVANSGIINASSSTTIEHTVYDPAPPSVVRWLLSNARVSPYDGNLLEIRPDGLYVNLSSQLTACGFGANIRPSTEPLPLRLLALDSTDCIVSVPAEDVARYICAADCTPTVDLTVTKTVSDSHVSPGTPITFVITVANAGIDDAADLIIQDSIPTEFVGEGPYTVVYAGGAAGPAVVTRSNLGAGIRTFVPAGGSVTITATVAAWTEGRYSNTVLVSLPDIYTNEGNFSDTVQIRVAQSSVDLQIQSLVGLSPAFAVNQFGELRFLISNNSDVASPSPVWTGSIPVPYFVAAWPIDIDPVEVTIFQVWTGTSFNVPVDDFVGIYNLPPIPAGGQLIITIPVQAVLADTWSESYGIQDLALIDSVPSNNTVTLSGVVTP